MIWSSLIFDNIRVYFVQFNSKYIIDIFNLHLMYKDGMNFRIIRQNFIKLIYFISWQTERLGRLKVKS